MYVTDQIMLLLLNSLHNLDLSVILYKSIMKLVSYTVKEVVRYPFGTALAIDSSSLVGNHFVCNIL